MGGHFATRTLNEDGTWKDLMADFNSSADISPTGGQMPRLVGLAQASKVFKAMPELAESMSTFTNGGDEIAVGTIGDASTSEGLFWESMNAACVLEVPMLMSVWDDGYGISVPKKYQTVKESISYALSGFQREEGPWFGHLPRQRMGLPQLDCHVRGGGPTGPEDHVPVLSREVTQPQGHSTSGSHERYKTEERLAWAAEYDCIRQMGEFLLKEGAATQEELDALRKEAKKDVRAQQKQAWAAYRAAIDEERLSAANLLAPLDGTRAEALRNNGDAGRAEVAQAVRRTPADTAGETSPSATRLDVGWRRLTATTTAATAARQATAPTGLARGAGAAER